MLSRSIFAKLLLFNIIIIILSFCIFGITEYNLLGSYVIEKKEATLRDLSKDLKDLVIQIRALGVLVPDTNRALNISIEYLANSANAYVFILNGDGTVFRSSSNIPGKIYSFTKEQYGNVFLGESVRNLGKFHNMFSEDRLTIGIPINENGQVVGAVFSSVSAPEVYQLRYDIFRLFFLTALITIIIAFAFAYFLSKKISNPIKQLRIVAKSISNGEFHKRVDIHTKDELEDLGQTFNLMAESLEKLENMRRSFIANVSHELRTPMTTISGFIEGIIDDTIPVERHKQYLEIVLEETKRMSRLVNELLEVARMDSGKSPLEKTSFDIYELIKITLFGLEARIVRKNIQVNIHFLDNNCIVSADKDKIKRVVTNLLDNAIKFTNEGGEIVISVKPFDGKTVQISIKNTGSFISKEDLFHVFERFYKGDKSREGKSGVGLGLYIVKNIIALHNQKIWADSCEQYTEFAFTLELL